LLIKLLPLDTANERKACLKYVSKEILGRGEYYDVGAYSALDELIRRRQMIHLKRAISAGFLATVLVQVVAAHAATYYVATTGSDANTCAQAKTQGTPRLTITAGVKCLASGDTLIIKAGRYVGQQIYNPPAGSASAYTVIKGDPAGARPVLMPNGQSYQRGFYCDRGAACAYIEIRHLEITGAESGVKLSGSSTVGWPHHINIIDNVIHNTVGSALGAGTSDTGYLGGDHLIQGNEFYNIGIGTPGYPPGTNTIYNPGNRTIIEKNKFHNLSNGIGIWHAKKYIQNVIVRSNVFYDIGRPSIDTWEQGNGGFSAIHVSVPGGGHQIYNNIIYRSGEESSFGAIKINPLWDAAGTASVYIYNNTIYDLKNSGAAAVKVNAMASITGGPHFIKNNIIYLAGAGIIGGGTQSNNLTEDPSFMDQAGADFRLLSRSPAIDKGIAVTTVPIDFGGVPRPQGAGYDIGAYEAGDGSAPLAPRNLDAH